MSYKPLPDCLTIKESPIHGMGIFAKKTIDKDVVLGLTHHKIEMEWTRELVRTPLGGYLNHSFTPNATVEQYENGKGKDYSYHNYKLVVTKPIEPGEEITLDYTKQPCGTCYGKGEPWLQKTEEILCTASGNIFLINTEDKPEGMSWKQLVELVNKFKVINSK